MFLIAWPSSSLSPFCYILPRPGLIYMPSTSCPAPDPHNSSSINNMHTCAPSYPQSAMNPWMHTSREWHPLLCQSCIIDCRSLAPIAAPSVASTRWNLSAVPRRRTNACLYFSCFPAYPPTLLSHFGGHPLICMVKTHRRPTLAHASLIYMDSYLHRMDAYFTCLDLAAQE